MGIDPCLLIAILSQRACLSLENIHCNYVYVNLLCYNWFVFLVSAHNAVLLKAESMADKVEWMNKIGNVIQPSRGQMKGPDSGLPMRQSFSDGSLVSYQLAFVSL